MAVTRVFACLSLWVRTFKARFSRALCVRPIMGRSTQTLKTDLRDPDLRSRSMWCYVRFDTARNHVKSGPRLQLAVQRQRGLLTSAMNPDLGPRVESSKVACIWRGNSVSAYKRRVAARSLTLHDVCYGNNDDKKKLQWESCLLTTVSSIERSSVRNMPSSFSKDLDQLQQWEVDWQMEFHPKLCQVLHVTNKRNIIEAFCNIHGHILEETHTAKYLGVNIHHKLSWNHHIRKVTSKTNSTRAFLQRNIHQCPHETKVLCYKTLLRPVIEYASIIWDPHTNANINILKMIQRRYAKFVFHDYRRSSSVIAMLDQPHWASLQERRA